MLEVDNLAELAGEPLLLLERGMGAIEPLLEFLRRALHLASARESACQ